MQISVIIPTYNEAQNIGDLVAFLREHGGSQVAEVIVADGNSTDQTCRIAQEAGALTIISPQKGRAWQMNTAATKAKGDLLYFVHADVVPPTSFASDIIAAVEEGFDFGNYASLFESRDSMMQFNGRFTQKNWLITRGGGDQTLFVKRATFSELNGFDTTYVLMEDFDFVRRARRKHRFKIMPKEVFVSTRKYANNSYLRVNLVNLAVYTGFVLRFPPKWLSKAYAKWLRSAPAEDGKYSMVKKWRNGLEQM